MRPGHSYTTDAKSTFQPKNITRQRQQRFTATVQPNSRAVIDRERNHGNKKTPSISERGFVFKAWRCPTLTWGGPTLPSALSSFTSEFEMGSGGSYLLLPPVKLV